jgi:ADP-heptose:LPS heptosyltransferase
MPEQRFLVLRLGSLGDIVHSFPAVASLRDSFPSSEIIWLTHPRWNALVRSSGLATEVWNVDSRDLGSVRAVIKRIVSRKPDTSIDYQGLWKAALLPFLARVPQRIGFSSQTIREFGVPILYTERVECTTTHIADQNTELSLRAGARNPCCSVTLRVCSSEESDVAKELRQHNVDRYIVLSPGGGWRSKCWPAERFGSLCQKIRDVLGLRCVINYGPGEEGLAEAVRAASGAAEPVLYDDTLGKLMALLRNAVCIVGGDTGPLHLAIALGTRAVALYGPTDPARNGPYHCGATPLTDRGLDIVLRAKGASTSHKRVDQTDPSMLAIQVDEVFDAVCRRIGAA